MKKIRIVLLAGLILFSCKKKKEEEITVDIVGSWDVVTYDDGATNPFDQSAANMYNVTSNLSFNDSCLNTVDYTWLFTIA